MNFTIEEEDFHYLSHKNSLYDQYGRIVNIDCFATLGFEEEDNGLSNIRLI